MKESEIINYLSEVFYDVFQRKIFDTSLTMNNIAEWDSLRHIALIMEIEKKFNIQIKQLDIIEMISVGKILTILKDYLNCNE